VDVLEEDCIDQQYHKGFLLLGTMNLYKSTVKNADIQIEVPTGHTSFFVHNFKPARTYDLMFYCLCHEGSSPGKHMIYHTEPDGTTLFFPYFE
jgi:hypothetical protein